MIRNFFAVILAYVIIGAWAFSGKGKTGKTASASELKRTLITGRVSPADGVDMVWVISGKDTTKTAYSSGSFSVEVKPGMHTLVVDAKNPYKDVILDNLQVTENQVLELGEIILKQ